MMFRPWLFVIIAFLLVMTAWGTFIYIAIHHSPERISTVKPTP